MEGGSGFSNLNKTVRKRRSNRARTNSQSGLDNRENSPHSGSKASSDENNVDFTNSSRKDLNLNQFDSRVVSYINTGEAEIFDKIIDENREFVEFGEGISEKKDNKNSININKADEIKLKRVKLKLGGVTRTLHANFSEPSQIDATLQKQKQNPQEDSDSDSPFQHKGTNLRGIPWKDFSNTSFSDNKKATEPVRKSKRVPKRKSLDDDDDHHSHDDMEIRFLEKLRNSKYASVEGDDDDEDDDELSRKKHRKISRVMNMTENAGDYSSSSIKENKKLRSAKVSDDNDYVEFADVAVLDSKIEMVVTTRQRAHLQTSASPVDFPNGLPLAPPRKQKERLNDVEQQLKKAEAAQKRKMQVEKAARESEAEAIRKILGQDSSRKKREDKIKKRQEELAQERTVNVKTLAGNTVRWNMGPTGTTITFPDDTGLPSILEPKPCCYPPPREKCAGPFCTNPYKYRDSKSKLPLCSLRCYKAIHEKTQPLSAC